MKLAQKLSIIALTIGLLSFLPFWYSGHQIQQKVEQLITISDALQLVDSAPGIFHSNYVLKANKLPGYQLVLQFSHGPLALVDNQLQRVLYQGSLRLQTDNNSAKANLITADFSQYDRDRIEGSGHSTMALTSLMAKQGIKDFPQLTLDITASEISLDIPAIKSKQYTAGQTNIVLENYTAQSGEQLVLSGSVEQIQWPAFNLAASRVLFKHQLAAGQFKSLVHTLEQSILPLVFQQQLSLAERISQSKTALVAAVTQGLQLASIIQINLDDKVTHNWVFDAKKGDLGVNLILGHQLSDGVQNSNIGLSFSKKYNQYSLNLNGEKKLLEQQLAPYLKQGLQAYIALMGQASLNQAARDRLAILSLFTRDEHTLQFYAKELEKDMMIKRWLVPDANGKLKANINIDANTLAVTINGNDLQTMPQLVQSLTELNDKVTSEVLALRNRIAGILSAKKKPKDG